MRIGKVIKKWRLVSDISVRDAAQQIGIAPSTLVHIESGKMPPHSTTLISLWNWAIGQEPETTDAQPEPADAGD